MKVSYKFNAILSKISASKILVKFDREKHIIRFIWKGRETRISQNNFEKEKLSWRTHTT